MKTKKENTKNESLRYWFVDITLTSGEVLKFYVKALTLFDAYEKADGYTYWASNETLKNKLKSFKLMV